MSRNVDPNADTEVLTAERKIKTTYGVAFTVLAATITIVATTVACYQSMRGDLSSVMDELKEMKSHSYSDRIRLDELWWKHQTVSSANSRKSDP